MFFTSWKSFGFLWSSTRQNFHKAAIQNTRSFCIMAQLLDKIPDVDIDANGVFKYVLIMVHDDENKQSKPIVRGYSRASWHDKRRYFEYTTLL
ncbi:14 kDa phosphohistidine phosphatase isoform X1 [Cephus cinctus]|uniref:14 kDa phosphohistidine phosphatase isoform X1 n=1 Tax=Cephus cinctus TaxID=211228 RepID=A0AAJ7FS63_CEPCN|nr:14 kDa phosphohistidine phosphatase isoform X1 [Cephus cinctus]